MKASLFFSTLVLAECNANNFGFALEPRGLPEANATDRGNSSTTTWPLYTSETSSLASTVTFDQAGTPGVSSYYTSTVSTDVPVTFDQAGTPGVSSYYTSTVSTDVPVTFNQAGVPTTSLEVTSTISVQQQSSCENSVQTLRMEVFKTIYIQSCLTEETLTPFNIEVPCINNTIKY